MGEVEIRAVDGICFPLKRRICSCSWPKWCGETTVLNILGGMDTASSGQVLVDGSDVAKYNSRQLTGYRRDDIGFVFSLQSGTESDSS